MKALNLLLAIIVSTLFSSAITSAQGFLYEVSFEEKLNSSSHIVEGRVTSKKCYWNDTYTTIFTLNKIQCQNTIKGELQDFIFVRTEGGQIDGNELSVSHQLQLNIGDEGLFFLYSEPEFGDDIEYLNVYSSSQGFLKYDDSYTRVSAPFVQHSKSELKTLFADAGYELPESVPSQNKSLPLVGDHSITSFSPESAAAGAFETMTIIGTGFGENGPDELNYVAFKDADDGGESWIPAQTLNYQNWSDSSIELYIPSYAGSGKIQVVIDGNPVISEEEIQIDFALDNNSTPNYFAFHANVDDNGGYIFSKSIGFINEEEAAAFDRALNTWVCQTGVFWEVDPNWVTASSSSIDDVNVVAWGSFLPAGVLSSSYVHTSFCSSPQRYIRDIDILFRHNFNGTLVNWYSGEGNPASSEIDFESAALHELGHALFLDHVNNTQDPMYFNPQVEPVRREPHPKNLIGANFQLSLYPEGVCEIPELQPLDSPGCDFERDAALTMDSRLTEEYCTGNHPVHFELFNLGSEPIYTASVGWSINGQPQPTFFYGTPLLPFESSGEMLLGQYNFVNEELFEIKAWVEESNFASEVNQTNDTITYVFEPSSCTSRDANILDILELPEYGCDSELPVYTSIENTGETIIFSLDFDIYINGNNIGESSWSGILYQGELADSIEVENLTLDPGSLYNIEVIITAVNGFPDFIEENNHSSISYTPNCPEYDVELMYVTETSVDCPDDPFSAELCFRNLGTETLNSADIIVERNGEVIFSETWVGELGTNEFTCFESSGLLLEGYSSQFHYNITNPNGFDDQIDGNNHIFKVQNQNGLSGTYTLGGDNPDFHTFSDLATALTLGGVCNEVIIDVRPGNYSEQFVLSYVQGTSEENTITIRSENGVPDDVILRHRHNSTAENSSFTLGLFGTAHLSIESITIESLIDSNGIPENCRVVKIDRYSSNIRFENNIIESRWAGIGTNPDLTYTRCIDIGDNEADSIAPHHLVFDGNLIKGGATALSYNGAQNHYEDYPLNLDITDNRVECQGNGGISITKGNNLNFSGNEFLSSTANEGDPPMGLLLTECTDGIEIHNNWFSMLSGIAVQLNYCTPQLDLYLPIYNNIIHMDDGTGISISTSDQIELVHNTVVLSEESQLESSGVRIGDATNTVFKNNLLTNYGLGVSIDISDLDPLAIEIDNNNYYTNGEIVVAFSGDENFSSLSDYQENSGLDLFSHELDPWFFFQNQAIPMNLELNDLGTPSSYNFDFTGQERGSIPDIGAFEFNNVTNDVALLSVELDPADNCSIGTPVYVEIANGGQLNLEQCEINWSFNGTEGITTFNGNLEQFQSEESIYLTSIDLVQNMSNSLTVWVSSPNEQVDEVPANDTVQLNGINTPMSGIYSIGNSLSDYLGIQDAINALINRGICSDVVFNVESGTYAGNWVIPVIAGTNENSKITFQSSELDATTVTLTGDFLDGNGGEEDYIFKLSGDGFIEMKDLTFTPPEEDGLFSSVLIHSGTQYVVENCRFIESEWADKENHISIHVDAQSAINNLTIANCFFRRGFENIVIDGNQITSLINITSNICELTESNGIRLNEIEAVYIYDNFVHSHNLLGANSITSPFEVKSNHFLETSQQYFAQKPFLINCTGSEIEPIKFYNNFVKADSRIVIEGTSNLNFFHNSLSRTYYFPESNLVISESSNLSLINNINTNTSIFGLEETPPFAVWEGDVSNSFLDYNCFGTQEETHIILNGESINFEDWQTNFFQDQNSIHADPNFVSNGDLHLDNDLNVDGMGTPLADVTVDYDGDIRDLTNPDIGADEYEVNFNELFNLKVDSLYVLEHLQCSSNDSTFISITNISGVELNTMQIEWEIDAVSQAPLSFDGVWSDEEARVFYLGSPSYPSEQVLLSAHAILPNGYSDADDSDNHYNRLHQPLAPLNILINDTEFCTTEPALVSVEGGIGSEFYWSNGLVGTSITVNEAQNLVVSNNQSGCIVEDSVQINTISVNESIEINSQLPALCEGELTSLTFTATEGVSSIEWSNGSTDNQIITIGNTWNSIVGYDNNGCSVVDSIYIPYTPALQPIITLNQDTIMANSGVDFIWFYNNEVIQGESDNIYIASNNGEYHVQVLDQYGCWHTSNTVTYLGTDNVNQITSNSFQINFIGHNSWVILGKDNQRYKLQLFDVQGNLVKDYQFVSTSHLDLNTMAAGLYILRLDQEVHKLVKY